MSRPKSPPEELEARTKRIHEIAALAADLCGMEPSEVSALSEAYSLAATGKHAGGGRSLVFHRALATNHVFRGKVLKWWYFDRRTA